MNLCLAEEGAEPPCGEREVCTNIPGGFECTNLEDKFEAGDPDKLVITSEYPLGPDRFVFTTSKWWHHLDGG